ncbi:MAG TPA: hypothetical protein VHH88_06885 [Verrucomicrobiae bacterium]|nr:hypothetical protein [Verrucomicrobiae bacterium]
MPQQTVPSLMTAVQEQPVCGWIAQRPIETLIINHIERPMENRKWKE